MEPEPTHDIEQEVVLELKWYQRPRWLASLAALIAAISFAVFVGVTTRAGEQAQTNGQELAELQRAVSAIEKNQDSLEKNQEGIDKLVAFTEQYVKRQGQVGLDVFLDILCATTDPVRLETCARYGVNQ